LGHEAGRAAVVRFGALEILRGAVVVGWAGRGVGRWAEGRKWRARSPRVRGGRAAGMQHIHRTLPQEGQAKRESGRVTDLSLFVQ